MKDCCPKLFGTDVEKKNGPVFIPKFLAYDKCHTMSKVVTMTNFRMQ